MFLQKWNYKKHKYELYKIPNKWNCQTFCEDMKEIVNCPHCGKKIEYGKCFTSMEIHTPFSAFGYAVCRRCYEKEWERRKKYKDKQ